MGIKNFFKIASLATMMGGASLSFGQTQDDNSDQHYDVSPVAMIEETGIFGNKLSDSMDYQYTLFQLRSCQDGIGGTYTHDTTNNGGTAVIKTGQYTKTIQANANGFPIQMTEDFGNSYNKTQWRDDGTLKSKTSNTQSDLLTQHTQEEYDSNGILEHFSSTTEYHNLNRSKKIEKHFENGHLISTKTLIESNGKQRTSSTQIEHNGPDTTVTTEINGSVRVQKFSKDRLVSDSNKIETSRKPMSVTEKQKRLEKYRLSK